MKYQAPIQDISFSLKASGAYDIAAKVAHEPELFEETVNAVLNEAGRFFVQEVAPGNQQADIEGARFTEGCVHVPKAISVPWLQYTLGGWMGLRAPEAYGGQGLSKVLAASVTEMLNSSNLALGSGLLLCEGAIEALLIAGSDEQREEFLPRLISGAWSGTMNLTEPQAGSDLSQIRTIATPCEHYYLLKGQKIFITFGEQDFTENILHLVLARTPGAPAGVKGISLFLCSKYLKENNEYTRRNDIRCMSIEHKLGIKASPTCVLSFGENEGAVGYLVGEENRGLEYMFLMMNTARFTVGVQGIGIAERAYQAALDYAKERVQGKPIGEAVPGNLPIVDHPDVRRMLLTMKSQIEASRGLALYIAACIDGAERAVGEHERHAYRRRAEFLIPIHKGHATELAVEITSMAVQVHGGMGFIEETGVAQLYRDARILPIYEGTTAIQANDLVGRKTLRDGGETALQFVSEMQSDAIALMACDDDIRSGAGRRLRRAADALETIVRWLLDNAADDPKAVYAASVPYLRAAGYALGAWQMARSITYATEQLSLTEVAPSFLSAKVATAEFYLSWIASQSEVTAQGIVSGAGRVMQTSADYL